MEKITTVEDLKAAILALEIKQAEQKVLLKQQVQITYESLAPINLIKNSFKDFISAPGLRENVLDSAISLAAGYLSKKMVVGTTQNSLKKLLGNLLQIGVTSVVSKNADEIRSTITGLVSKFTNSKKTN